jgi:hypothetical protein
MKYCNSKFEQPKFRPSLISEQKTDASSLWMFLSVAGILFAVLIGLGILAKP